MHTLILSDDWDLTVDANGNLSKTNSKTQSYAIAQNVANAFMLFTDDAYFFSDKGIPHFLLELRKNPQLNVLKSRLKETAEAVQGVKKCDISFLSSEDRELSGIAVLTLESGEVLNVEF